MTAVDQSESSPILETLTRVRVRDVDTHITEPGDVWTSRMSSKWGDAVPHTRPNPTTGKQQWYINGEPGPSFGEGDLTVYDEQTAAGATDACARLAWMDLHGVFTQVLYPNILGFFPRAFVRADRAFGVDCVRAYNDFQTDFASADPERLIPTTYLPWWDIDAAVAELERCHDRGHRSINLAWEYEKAGLPPLRDEHWTPLLKTAEERTMTVNFHVGFNTEDLDYQAVLARSRLDQVATSAKFFMGNVECIVELIMGRICHRFPTLKFVSVESGIGFVPYLLEALQWQFLNSNMNREYPDMLLPSDYFRRQIYGTFWFERDIADLAHLYPDNFMFETDYPHASSLTPAESLPYVAGPHETIATNLGALPEDLVIKLVEKNACGVYQLA